MKGRKPIPIHTLQAKGTFRPDRHSDNDHAFKKQPALRAPAYLSKEGKRQFLAEGKKLIKSGVLVETDIPAFAELCCLQGMAIEFMRGINQWESEQEELFRTHKLLVDKKRLPFFSVQIKFNEDKQAEEIRGICQNPSIRDYHRILPELNRLRAEFGLTPSSRTRVKIEKPSKENPYAEFG